MPKSETTRKGEWSARVRAARAARRAAGTCSECDQPPVPGRKKCAEHGQYYLKVRAQLASNRTYELRGIPDLESRRVFTTGQVAAIAGVCPRTAAEWVDSGLLAGYRLPGSQDRRVGRDALVAFLTRNGMPVPHELRDGCMVVYGADVAVPNAVRCNAFDLGILVAQKPVACAVIGDADGMSNATGAGQLVRSRNPFAVLLLVIGPDVPEPSGAPWDAVYRVPFDPAILTAAVEKARGV